MGSLDVRVHALSVTVVHQGDWSASSSDLFNVGGGNLVVNLQYCVRLTTKAEYVTTVRSNRNWLMGVSDGVGLLSVAQRSKFLRYVLDTNSTSS
jgi:hypothetical protein